MLSRVKAKLRAVLASAHFRAQVVRAVRLAVVAFAASTVAGGSWDAHALGAAAVAAVEVAVRQVWPTARIW